MVLTEFGELSLQEYVGLSPVGVEQPDLGGEGIWR